MFNRNPPSWQWRSFRWLLFCAFLLVLSRQFMKMAGAMTKEKKPKRRSDRRKESDAYFI